MVSRKGRLCAFLFAAGVGELLMDPAKSAVCENDTGFPGVPGKEADF